MSTFHPVHDALAIASRSNGHFVIIHKLSGRTFHIAYAKQADAESARAQIIASWNPSNLISQFIKNADQCLLR